MYFNFKDLDKFIKFAEIIEEDNITMDEQAKENDFNTVETELETETKKDLNNTQDSKLTLPGTTGGIFRW